MDKFIPTREQKETIKVFMKFLLDPNERFMIIQGTAGSGKTTMIRYILRAIEKEYKLLKTLMCKDPDEDDFNILLTATTNKAVAVLRELSGNPEVRTIHSTLGLKLRKNFSTGEENLIKTDRFRKLHETIVILDEGSMLDSATFGYLDEALGPKSKAVLIGDVFQLAPIQEKMSMMQKIQCPTAIMNKVLRHTGTILETATLFREIVKTGVFQNIPVSDEVIHVDGPTFQHEVESAFLDPNYRTNKAKVLAWSNDRVQMYNHHIRGAMGLSQQFQEGEIAVTNKPIMAAAAADNISVDSEVEITWLSNPVENYGVMGRNIRVNEKIRAFLPDDYAEAKKLIKKISRKAKSKKLKDDHASRSALWKSYFEIKETWLDLRSSYASTVHKSQGSSYDKVFIDLSDIGRCNTPSDTARMLYVALSRARKQVILYGNLPVKYQGRIAA